MTGMRLYLVAAFAFRVRIGECKHFDEVIDHVLSLPIEEVPNLRDVYNDHMLYAQVVMADSAEDAEALTLRVLRKVQPESEGWAGHRASVMLADRQLIKDMLAVTSDECGSAPDEPELVS